MTVPYEVGPDFWEFDEEWAKEAEEVQKSRTSEWQSYVKGVLGGVTTTTTTLSVRISYFGSWLIQNIWYAIESLATQINSAFSSLIRSIGDLWNAIVSNYTKVINWATTQFTYYYNIVTARIDETWSWFTSRISDALGWWISKYDAVVNWVTARINDVQSWFTSQWSNTLATAMASLAPSINSWNKVLGDFFEFFSDPEAWLYKIADRIIERFW